MYKKSFYRSVLVQKFSIIGLFVIFSLGLIGGCNDNNGSGGEGETRTPIHGVLLGMHSNEALQGLNAELDLGEHTGEANHIHLDGKEIGNLTDEEKVLIRQAYNQGFIISLYDMDEARIQRVYRDVLQDPDVHSEEDFVEVAAEEEYFAFNIEQIDGRPWSSIATNDAIDMIEEFQNIGGNVGQGEPDPLPNEYRIYGEHTRNWIEDQPLRKDLLLDDGIVSSNPRALINELEARNVDRSGNVFDLAKTWIHTNTFTVDFLSSGAISGSGIDPNVVCGQAGLAANNCRNTYTITNQAWIITNQSPSSFLFVLQDMTLDNTAGEIVGESVSNDSRRQKAWYMSKFTVANYVFASPAGLLSTNDAVLDSAFPGDDFNAINISKSSFGNARFDTNDGGSSTSSTLNWTVNGTSDFGNLSIENVSETLAQQGGPQLGNDASWIYSAPVPGKKRDVCRDRFLDDPISAAKGVTNPTHAFVIEIDGFPGETLTLKTSAQVVLNNTRLSGCNSIGCRCDTVTTDKVTKPDGTLPIVFNQSINIPNVP
ncbi:MAG: hypothetical protein AAF462_05520 [Thermodesulfobacteriota bacterium]